MSPPWRQRSEFVLAGRGVRAEVLGVFLHCGYIGRRGLLDGLECRVLVAVLDQALWSVISGVTGTERTGPQRTEPGTDTHADSRERSWPVGRRRGRHL